MSADSPAQDALDIIGIASVCERVADCITLQRIADDSGVSKGSLITWLARDGHADQYARALLLRGDKLAEDILAIADDGLNDTYIDADGIKRTDQDVVARSRLRIDARKWLAGKMNSKYSEKTQAEISGALGLTVQILKFGED